MNEHVFISCSLCDKQSSTISCSHADVEMIFKICNYLSSFKKKLFTLIKLSLVPYAT